MNNNGINNDEYAVTILGELAMNDNESYQIIRSEKGDLLFTPESVDHNLPALLLDGLERRWVPRY
jgi:hypothetical protein